MFSWLLTRYRRNKQFEQDIPQYKFALKKWVWRGKRKLDKDAAERLEVATLLELLMNLWLSEKTFFRMLLNTPPDDLIQRALCN